jgi:hypothetical protein
MIIDGVGTIILWLLNIFWNIEVNKEKNKIKKLARIAVDRERKVKRKNLNYATSKWLYISSFLLLSVLSVQNAVMKTRSMKGRKKKESGELD